jgi:drug/metabolite transporter (DMT)-like permease
MSRPDRADLGGLGALVAAAFLFGITFVVIKDAVEDVPPLSFVGWRFLIGAVALVVLALPRTSAVWRDGSIGGLWLFAGFAFQTVGLTQTDATNSALITGLYVVFTPLLAAAWNRRLPSPWVVVGTVVGFIGLSLLTVGEGLTLSTGDLLTAGCAVSFAGHIVYLSKTASRHPVIPFTAVQLLTTAVLGLIGSLLLEGPVLPGRGEWAAIVLTGVGVSAGAFILQVWAQTRIGPGMTAMVLTLEPVFGVAAGAIVLSERLAIRGWIGAALIFGAIQLVLTRGADPVSIEAEALAPGH